MSIKNKKKQVEIKESIKVSGSTLLQHSFTFWSSMLLHFENLELVLSVIMSVYEKLKPVFRSADFAEFKLDSNQFKCETSRMFTRRTKKK